VELFEAQEFTLKASCKVLESFAKKNHNWRCEDSFFGEQIEVYADDFFYFKKPPPLDPPKNETNSTDPTDPVDPPIDPVDPPRNDTNTTEPTDPPDPPIDPVNPPKNETNTTEPVDPTEPTDPPIDPVDPTRNETNSTEPIDPVDPPVEPEPPVEPDEKFAPEVLAIIFGLGSTASLTSTIFALLEDSIPCVVLVCDLINTLTYLVFTLLQVERKRDIVTISLGSAASLISLVIYTGDCT